MTRLNSRVMYEICCELWDLCLPARQCVCQYSLRVGVCHSRLLKWETSMLVSSSLWLQHPDRYPVNYKIGIEMHSRSVTEKFITWTDRHYGMALHYALSITQQMSDTNVTRCQRLSKHRRRTLHSGDSWKPVQGVFWRPDMIALCTVCRLTVVHLGFFL